MASATNTPAAPRCRARIADKFGAWLSPNLRSLSGCPRLIDRRMQIKGLALSIRADEDEWVVAVCVATPAQVRRPRTDSDLGGSVGAVRARRTLAFIVCPSNGYHAAGHDTACGQRSPLPSIQGPTMRMCNQAGQQHVWRCPHSDGRKLSGARRT